MSPKIHKGGIIMLLSFKEGIIDSRAYDKFEYPEFDIYLSGFIFVRKLKAGKESLDFLARELEEKHAVPFAKLFGMYAIIIDFKDSDRFIAFTDNSSLHGMFITDNSLGSNYVELARHDGLKCFDELGVCEYIMMDRHGLSGHTLIEGIRSANYLEYYEVSSGKCSTLSKGIEDIDGKTSIDDPFEFFGDIAHAVSDMKAICSLTGGYDSRMVASIMNTFRPFECFISGDNEASREIACAVNAAKAGGFKMRVIHPELPEQSDSHTYKLLMGGGGIR